MINKYIKSDPIPWLIEEKNPAVRYHTKNEILKNQDHEEIYKELINSDLTDFFKKNYSNNVLGDSKNTDIFYRGSVWFFLLAVESGYNHTEEFVESTADYLCKKTQLDNGGFKFNYRSSDAVGCRSGNMILSLIKSGINDSRSENGIKWVVNNQRKDGGWLHCPVAGFCDVMKLVFLNKSGSGLKYENIEDVSSCPVASYSCLRALVYLNDFSHKNIVKKAAEYFLKNNFFISRQKRILCGNSVNFAKIGYPVMSQYDYLSGLILLSGIMENGININDELFNNIIKKQNDDGTWNCENRLPGMIKEKEEKSRWTTLNAMRLIYLTEKNKA